MWKRILAGALAIVMAAGSVAYAAPDTENDGKAENSAYETFLDGSEQEERSIDFNKDWSFQLGDDTEAMNWDYDDSSWRKVDVPHDWSIEQDFTNAVQPEIGHLPGGIGWYRKSFVLPENMADKRINVDFGGVYMDSTIYVNGELVGNYPYGYIPFSYDITDYLVCDGKTENVIAVRVNSPTNPGGHSSRWYSGSGIYRDVALTVTDDVHVKQYGTVVTTPDLEAEYETGTVNVQVKTTVQNEGDQEASVKVRHSILNYEDQSEFVAPAESESVSLDAGAEQVISQTIQAVNPKLWSTEDPNLYTVRTEVVVDDRVVDTYDTRFGFRWFEFDSEEGFSLNGEYTKLQGVCMHHDQGAMGAALYEASVARQMKIMKEMGANAIRVSHNPAGDALLKQCDEQGLLVIEEAFDTWNEGKLANDYHRFFDKLCTHPDAGEGVTWAQFDLQQMVRRGINYPSIIMWSLGNEVYESWYDRAVDVVKNLVKWTKEIDTTRPTTMGEDKMRDNDANGSVDAAYVKIAKEVDVVGINYGEHNYDGYHEMYPDWCIYGSETSSAIKSRGYYSDPEKSTGASDVVQYQLSSYSNLAVGWGKTATDSIIPDRDRKWIGGQFVWTGFDYIGEPTPYSAQPKSSYFGLVDTAGFPKDDYYLYQSQWLDVEEQPMVHILPHWNWEDEELLDKVLVDGKIPVRVYSNAPTVELFVNGVSQGEKSFAVMTTSDGRTYQQQSEESTQLYLEWPLEYEYEPGTCIEAVAKDASGKTIATDSITTAGKGAKLEAAADRQVIEADGKDLAYITVDVQDAEGNFMPTAMNQLYFSISGNGKIVGVDNGDASSWERYKDTDGVWKRKAFNGKALVIVQSTEEEGSFTLTVSGTGLSKTTETVYTKKEDTKPDAILGYEVPEQKTDVGVMPVLPEYVSAVLADGRYEDKAVTWTLPDESQLENPGIVLVTGQVETGATVTLRLEVRGMVGIRDATVATFVGDVPTLPDSVTAIWSDGTTKECAVTWDNLEEEAVSQPGMVELYGDVEDMPVRARALIRVTDQTDDINIGLSDAGCSVTATYEEANGNHPAKQLNDGNLDSSNGWGNWENGSRTSDSVVMQLAESHTVDKITVWFNGMNTWQVPKQVTVEYWDGEAFVPVSNQSKTSDFHGRTSEAEDYAGDEISFDPVDTERLRITFSVNSFDPGKDMFKVTEVQVWSKGLKVNDSAKLKSISIDGAVLEEFDPDTLSYSVEVPYGEGIPQVSAEADAYASVFVLQALEREGVAKIEVVSEDGNSSASYTIHFTQLPPELETVLLTAERYEITEDDVIPLTVEGILQDGSQISREDATLTFTVEDIDGHAAVQNGSLLAYDAGRVRVTAHLTYKGKTVDSEPKEFVIAPNTAEKTVVSYEEVTVTTKPGVAPQLPDAVMATFDIGLPRELAVQWDEIDPEQYQDYGEFSVQGVVEGQQLRPTAKVIVREAVAMQTVTVATPPGVVPDLPEEIAGYFSDGSRIEHCPVAWDAVSEADLEQETGTVITVNGTAQIDGGTLPAKAQIRVADTITSPNYVIARNGYNLPMGLASYTNDSYAIGTVGYDRADYLNDGLKSFAMGTATEKKIWSNWVASTQRSGDWIGAIIAYEGQRVERYVDKISVGFFIETNGGQIQAPENYYVEVYTGPLDYAMEEGNGQVAAWQDSPLNDPANWKEVEYVSKPGVSQIDGQHMVDITFQPVKTNIVRVRMDARSGCCLGANELEVYGKEAISYSNYSMESISINGKNILDQFNEDGTYTYIHSLNEIPKITATANHNASITIVPPVHLDGEAKIIVAPEDGNELNTKVYTIVLEKTDAYENVNLTVTPSSVSLKEGESIKLQADLGVPEEELPDATLVWESSDTSLLKVEADGTVTALQLPEDQDERTATVKVSLAAAPEKAAVCTVIVAGKQSEVSKALLTMVCEAYAELDTSLYTEESAAALKDALERAEQILAQENAAEPETVKAVEDVLEAAAGLIFDTSDLEAKVAAAQKAADIANAIAEQARQAAGEANLKAETAEKVAQDAQRKLEEAQKQIEAQQEALKKAQEQAALAEKAALEMQQAAALAQAKAAAAEKAAQEAKAALEAAQKQLEESGQDIRKGSIYDKGGYYYKVTSVSGKTVEMTGIKNDSLTKIKVPNNVVLGGKRYQVTSIAASAFKNNKKVTAAVIGKNVKRIGNSAFSGCTKMTKVTIKSTKLTQIGSKAFFHCKKLKSITIKSKVLKKAGANALKGIHKKAVIQVPAAKKKAYAKLLSKKGEGRSVKIK